MKPKLTKVKALNNRQVQLTFSEEIDTLALGDSSIVFTTGTDTLTIIAAYPSLSAAEIICLSEPHAPVKYMVSGFVYDTAQNKGLISSSFTGSVLPDTLAPWIAIYSIGKSKQAFTLQFSEAMDTSTYDFTVLPEQNMSLDWQGLRTCRIGPASKEDILDHGFTYYLHIDGTFFDVSGNPVTPFITHITPDTVYAPFLLKGEVRINDTLVMQGTAVLKRSRAIGIAFLENGAFSFGVRDQEPYTVEVISNGYYGHADVWADSINLVVMTPEEKSLDSIIH